MLLISDDFCAEEASTNQLTEKHTALDEAITKQNAQVLGRLTVQEAKRIKCAIKTELGKRAKNGDGDATVYLERRALRQRRMRVVSEAA